MKNLMQTFFVVIVLFLLSSISSDWVYNATNQKYFTSHNQPRILELKMVNSNYSQFLSHF